MGKGDRGRRHRKQARLACRSFGYPGPRPQWNTFPFEMRRSILRRREREARARRRAEQAERVGRAGCAAAHAGRFGLYTLIGLLTTTLFWGAEALAWSMERGARSGRVAWQFILDLAARTQTSL